MESVWVAMTQEEGAFTCAFSSVEAALKWYEAEALYNEASAEAGFLAALTGVHKGRTWARPALSRADTPDIPGLEDLKALSEELAAVLDPPRGWYIHIWDPFDEEEFVLLLRWTQVR